MEPDDLKAEAAKLALPLLVERLGGVVEITEAEYDAFMARHAEKGRAPGVQIDHTPYGLRLTVVHRERPAAN